MLGKTTNRLLGIFATLLLCVFVLGLAHSISTGFAGFWRGLPFTVIAFLVLALAVYDIWQDTFKRNEFSKDETHDK